MEPYFIVSFPGTPEPSDTLKKVQDSIGGIEHVNPVTIPNLKVGTLDSLLNVADRVEKVDQYIQQVAFKVEKQLYEINKKEEMLKVDDSLYLIFFIFFY